MTAIFRLPLCALPPVCLPVLPLYDGRVSALKGSKKRFRPAALLGLDGL